MKRLVLPEAQGRGLTFWIVGFSAVIITAIVIHAIWFHERQREEAVHRALTDAQNLVRTLEEQTRTTLSWASFSLNSLAEAIEGPLARGEAPRDSLQAFVKQANDDTPDIMTFAYADAEGRVVSVLDEGTSERFAVDKADYFIAAKSHGQIGVHLIQPHWERGEIKPRIGLYRSLRHADGSFAGIVIGAIDANYFQQLHGQLELGKGSAVSILTIDGLMIARAPYREDFIGVSFTDTAIFHEVRAGSRSGTTLTSGGRDGTVRFAAYRVMQDFPLVVMLARAQDEVLTPLRRSGWVMVSYIGALIAMLVVLTGVLVALARRQNRVSNHLMAMLSNSNQGIVVFDRHQRLVSCNQRYSAEIFEFPPDFIRPGITYGEILAHLASRGEYGDQDAGAVISSCTNPTDLSQEQRLVHRRPNGKVLITYRKPIATGGFIITYTDITEDVRHKETAEAQSRLLGLVLGGIQQGIRVFDKDLNLVLANRRLVDTFGYPEDFARPGVNYEATVRISAELGEYGDENIESVVGKRLIWGREGVNHGSIRRTPNGRYVKKQRDPIPGGGFVSTYTDVTELVHAEAEVARKSALLELTQEHIGDGISVYDENLRLINFNKRWMEIWDMPPSLARIGTSYQDIMRRQIERGFSGPVADPDDYIKSRVDDLLERKVTSSDLTLPDGRNILIRRYAAPNGIVVINHTDITRLKLVETEAARKSNLLEAVLENMAQGMLVCDAELRVTAYNTKFHDLQGYRAEDMRIGMSYEEVLRIAAASGNVKTDDLDAFIAERMKSARSREVYYKEFPAQNGRYITLRRTPMPAGGFVTTAADTTARKRAEDALRASEERYRSLVMSSAQLIWTTDAEGCVIEPQPTWQAFTGQSDQEIMGWGWLDALHPDDMAPIRQAWFDAITNKALCNVEYRLRRHDGVYRTFSNRAVPVLNEDGGIREWVGICEDISERKQAEAEVMAKSALLEATFQNMAQGIIVFDEKLKLAAYNQRYIDLVGMPQDVIQIGKPMNEILQSLAERGDFGGDPRQQVRNRLGSVTKREQEHREVSWPGGRTLLVSHVPMPGGGIIKTFTDMSDRRQAEQALRESEQRLRAILDNIADAVITTDKEGLIQSFNTAAETIFGYAAEEVIGSDIRRLIPVPHIQPRNQVHPEEVKELAEMLGCRRDGTTFPIDIAVTSVELTGRWLQIAIVRDIGDQKALQAQLFQASKLATLGEMSAAMAHEMNQPLNVMRMAADNGLIRMERGIATDDYLRQNLALIASQAERLGKLVLHMRVFSRIEPAEFEPFDPRLSVAAAIELMTGQFELANIRLTTSLPANCGQVMGRPAQLEQVMINLLSNAQDAILAHPRRRPDTSIGAIEIALTESDGTIRVTVSDTGGGVPPEVIGRIFDPFFTTKEVGKGTGLGLSVSYGLISAMGGKITVDQTEIGAVFTVVLPVHAARKKRRPRRLQGAANG